tara:strand:+ start:2772 stop:3005 length:234 start_codon:yes stop_codon:yes gene_type:complete
MLFDDSRPAKKPVTAWELREALESVNERMEELSRRHRGEVAAGGVVWDSEEARKEYSELKAVRRKVRAKQMESARML